LQLSGSLAWGRWPLKRLFQYLQARHERRLSALLNAAEAFPDRTVQKVRVRNLPAEEIRTFCKAKKRTVRTAKKMIPEGGDVWTFTALDSDSKLMVSWFDGDRDNAASRA
jgi:hypothetical protein